VKDRASIADAFIFSINKNFFSKILTNAKNLVFYWGHPDARNPVKNQFSIAISHLLADSGTKIEIPIAVRTRQRQSSFTSFCARLLCCN